MKLGAIITYYGLTVSLTKASHARAEPITSANSCLATTTPQHHCITHDESKAERAVLVLGQVLVRVVKYLA